MVERRVRQAIFCVGSIWLSAWADAGQPDLTKIITKKLSAEEKKILEEEEKNYKQGNFIGRPEE